MIIGALVGRCFGLLIPDVLMDFLLSAPDVDTEITPEMRGALLARFAIVGAAAFSTGATRVFATVVTIYEVLCLPNTLLPLCSAGLAAIFTANKISTPFFDQNLIMRGLTGMTDIAHTDRAQQPAEIMMRALDGEHDCLEEVTGEKEIRELLNKDKAVEYFAIMHNVECSIAKHSVSSVLLGSVSRQALEQIILVKESMTGPRTTAGINLLHPEFTMPKEKNTAPLVSLNPISVPPTTYLKDVFIIMKCNHVEHAYVVDKNMLVGFIDQNLLLGHKL
jgi:hypothetical protein